VVVMRRARQHTIDLRDSYRSAERRRPGRTVVTVILPCLNEEQAVAATVREARHALAELGGGHEVLVVDNGSTDRSVEHALAAGARVVHEPLPGYGSALRAGIQHAAGDIVVMADADCTYPLHRLAELVVPVARGTADLMIGARLDGATRRSMLHRFVGTPVLTGLVRCVSGIDSPNLSDSQSGFRAFRRDTALNMHLQATGMEFASEMLIKANVAGLRITEVQLGYNERVGESKLNTWSDGMRHLRLIVGMGPHLMLWYPGIALMALSALLLGGSLLLPNGVRVGSLSWQPVFFGSISAVLGVCGVLLGALLASESTTVHPRVRERFAWVNDPRFRQRARNAGLALVLGGLVLDVVLAWAWVAGTTFGVQLQTAAIAQVLIIIGAIVTVFVVVCQTLKPALRAGHAGSVAEQAGTNHAAIHHVA
jgi:glycosyltransferase involved in cell wall biosynthesis